MNRIKLKDFLNDLSTGADLRTEIDIINYIDIDEVENFDDILQAIEDNGGFDIEVIYYSNAMEYLMEHDPSLSESMQLVADMGYSPENINSELLATLLKSQNVRNEFYELEDEINEFFELNICEYES